MKKKTTVAPRVTLKQKFEQYRTVARQYINTLRYPSKQGAFSVKGYEKTPTGMKPNSLSAPEILAIVGTAKKLGKNVMVDISGVENGGQLDFYFVDAPAPLPFDLEVF